MAIAIAIAVLAGSAPRAAHAALARDGFDSRDIAGMRAANPEATALFEKAETIAQAGKLDEALGMFQDVARKLPDAPLPHRRLCEVLTALGRGREGVYHCTVSLEVAYTNTAVRATVAALVGGPATPKPSELAQAVSLLTLQRKRASSRRAELSSALCDIANSLGDEVMLKQCVRELLSVAPHAPATLRAKARLDARCPPLRFWTGWTAIAAAILATLAHALRARIRRARTARTLRARSAAAVALVLGLFAAVIPVRTALALELPPANQMLSKFPINDADPESSIPSEAERNKDPLNFGYWLQDLIYKAEQATKHGDHLAAVKFYRTIVKAVPDRAIGYERLCSEYESGHDLEKAAAACGAALLQQGVTKGDYAHYIDVMLKKPGGLSSKDQETINDVLTNLKADPSAHPLVDLLECNVAERLQHIDRLDECVPVLVSKAANAPSTIRLELALALGHHRFGESGAIVERAKKAGAPKDVIEHMEQMSRTAVRRRTWALALWTAAGVLLAAGIAFSIVYATSRRKLAPTTQPT